MYNKIKKAIEYQNLLNEEKAWQQAGVGDVFEEKIKNRFELEHLDYIHFSDRDIEALVDNNLEKKIRVKKLIQGKEVKHFPSFIIKLLFIFPVVMLVALVVPNSNGKSFSTGFSFISIIFNYNSLRDIVGANAANQMHLIASVFIVSSILCLLGIITIKDNAYNSQIGLYFFRSGLVGFLILGIIVTMATFIVKKNDLIFSLNGINYYIFISLLIISVALFDSIIFILQSFFNFNKSIKK